ncbi:ThiF family adenylyltransferase [Xanthomonas phaseoli pv. phaseoli]|uniref:ThiF domain protein n=1 Tax=Xanthomonas campestris pv. phaseoli TaxID=317013 RepID=A0ABY1TP61_XANCH|nr:MULTISPECIES: ThiF family adenylyltransferase [Xanthomonas]ATS33385.2 ThiF family adenylyltransferase [Xanthomonas phaseoli pv. phaseoli]MCC5074582.1 ThiF family adenylyltransferase [Xanthomonas campestris pv. plantaginis]SON78272.1 ThiF domain protein [Xanthomonas phaseoli pv. phaseoli]
MSSSLISRSPELQRLRDEGFDLEVRDNHLLVKGIAYATVDKTVAVGTLVIALHLTADIAQTAPDHTAWFAGQVPCDSFGQPLNKIINSSSRMERAPGLWVDHYFSSKPKSGLYSGYYEQVSTYATMLLVHAQALDPRATATPGAISVIDQSQSVFAYEDSASPRAGLSVPTAKLRGQRIAIVGLGGTGAHLLDLICKTPVACLDLFDGDRIEQHNAFRYPGAVPFSVLKEAPYKVNYLARVYGEIHTRIQPNAVMVTEVNVRALLNYDTVFVCVDRGAVRELIANTLGGSQVIVIDVGMGVKLNAANEVYAVVRTTVLDGDNWDAAKATLPLGEGGEDDLYNTNAQIGELNALNAILAIEAWKKRCGYYSARKGGYLTTYATHSSSMASTLGAA